LLFIFGYGFWLYVSSGMFFEREFIIQFICSK
jgi:hypothetical protein